MTTVQRIEDSIQHMADEEDDADDLRYEIKFQNKAVESLFNTIEVENCLHMPSLLLADKKLSTLHEVTKRKNVYLSK